MISQIDWLDVHVGGDEVGWSELALDVHRVALRGELDGGPCARAMGANRRRLRPPRRLRSL